MAGDWSCDNYGGSWTVVISVVSCVCVMQTGKGSEHQTVQESVPFSSIAAYRIPMTDLCPFLVRTNG